MSTGHGGRGPQVAPPETGQHPLEWTGRALSPRGVCVGVAGQQPCLFLLWLGCSFCTIRRPSKPASLASRVRSTLKLYLENFTTTEGTGCHQLPNRDRIKADGHNRVPVFREKRQGPWIPLKNFFLFTWWAIYLNGYHLKILYFNRHGGQSQAWGGRVRYGGKPTTGGSECLGEAGAALKTSREIVSDQIITASTIRGLFPEKLHQK